MDVRCERCRAQYAVDDARVSEAGVKVACGQCGHGFLLRKKTLAVTVPLKGGDPDVPTPIAALATPGGASAPRGAEGTERGEWRLRQAGGAVYPFRELATLQRWIVERKASREDEVAAAGEGEAWRRLGDIPELQSFFSLLDRARSRREPAPEAHADGPPEEAPPAPSRPGMEDPAWASGPVPPTRRVTRSALRPPPPRRRVLWVAMLALALLGVAVGTVYLRRKAEADVVAAARREEAALAAQLAARPPPDAAPPSRPAAEPRPEPPKERPPDPAQQPPTEPAAPAASGEGVQVAPVGALVQAEPVPAAPAGPAPAAAAAPAQAGNRPPPPRDDAAAALKSLLGRAREQRDRGRGEAALDLYGQALAIDGRNAAALAGRGACYLDLSRYVQAEASFEGALDSDPRNAEALYGMAETYRYMGRKGEAVAFYEKFLAVRPNGDDAAAARRLISQLKE
jgi:predicted Zn finger-like uncharacterized protein